MVSLLVLILWLTSLFIQGIFGLNGGDEAHDGQFPYIVSLKRSTTHGHFCAGVIIGPEWILSAAHCFKHRTQENVLVFTGTLHLQKRQKNLNAIYHTLKKLTIHPNFKQTSVHIAHDLALLQLTAPLNFSGNIMPISLGKVDDESGIAVEAAGWGAEHRGLPLARKLRHGLFETMGTRKCQEIHDEVGNVVDGDTQICVFGGKEKAPCAGDSGGPLIKVDTKKLVGIFSGYEDCEGKFPALYVRLSAYVGWLRNVTGLDLLMN